MAAYVPPPSLARLDAATLTTPGGLRVGGALEVDAALNHDGAEAGFYGAAPVARPAALTAAAAAAPAATPLGATGWDTAADRDAAIAAVNNTRTRLTELETRLRALGLLT